MENHINHILCDDVNDNSRCGKYGSKGACGECNDKRKTLDKRSKGGNDACDKATRNTTMYETALNRRIRLSLKRIGIPVNHRGYRYILEAVILAYEINRSAGSPAINEVNDGITDANNNEKARRLYIVVACGIKRSCKAKRLRVNRISVSRGPRIIIETACAPRRLRKRH